MKDFRQIIAKVSLVAALTGAIAYFGVETRFLEASSHREAPLLVNDPLADNTDVYAFRSPDAPNTITIIANYIGLELPQGGPNYATFAEDVRYEIHVKNNPAVLGDDITYRFTFKRTNEDPTTFFNIRLGKQNLKATYTLERKLAAEAGFSTIVANGIVTPPNIGPRSINNATLGLGKTYDQIITDATLTSTSGSAEKVFCGSMDDPFFVDLGGIFDLGATRTNATARDGVGCTNVHAIALQIPISLLQKDRKDVTAAKNILDGDFVIGVWASASRPAIRTLSATAAPATSGDYVQVSRLGMPLLNEAVIPIGAKDKWNQGTPYSGESQFETYIANPELALYMDDSQFGAAVPAFKNLRVQSKASTALGNVDFRNTKDGAFVIKGNAALAGTALDDALFGNYLLRKGAPRSVDLVPIFHAGVPNLAPYQLATGKTAGNPLTAGKPFINTFLPSYSNGGTDVRFGDMLRLNMAVPPTSRTSKDFSSEGLVQAAVLGLTNATYNTTKDLQNIPNMDGFPNGRRLEDDVTRIELQAVSGVVLAAIGLFYDDYTYTTSPSPVTPNLVNVLTYTTGVEANDKALVGTFPYLAAPHNGFGPCGGVPAGTIYNDGTVTGFKDPVQVDATALASKVNFKILQNPFAAEANFTYHLTEDGKVTVEVFDITGKLVQTLENANKTVGDYDLKWNASRASQGSYLARVMLNGVYAQSIKLTHTN